MFDDLDDVPFDLNLRIPPIQSPKPYFASYRPQALEPDAGITVNGTKIATAKLGNMLKIAGDTPKDFREPATEPRGSNAATHCSDHRSSGETRKRQRVGHDGLPGEFVQLPKPIAKAKVEMLSFKPVPVLNELHEPPPSAALFPPITPKTLQEVSHTTLPPTQRSPELATTTYFTSPHHETGRKKRVSLRARHKWTGEETTDLLAGVGIYGAGKWKKILQHEGFGFHPERTPVDLKDRYRTCLLIEAKASAKSCNGGIISDSSSTWPERVPLPDKRKVDDSKDDMEKGSRRPALRWTKEEDEALARGYNLYGFRWTAISKDSRLGLQQKTGHQVRDRFRLRFSQEYHAAASRPLIENAGTGDAPTGSGIMPKSNSVVEFAPERSTTIKHLQNTPQVEPRDEPRSECWTPKHSSSASQDVSKLLAESETKAWQEQEIEMCEISGDEERRRKSPSPIEDIRHLGILGLLNDEEDDEQMSRLPALKFSYDDYEDNVTLPPLLWEDLATRPIFDLE